MHSPVQQIKERLGIEEVVSSYIKLEQAGVNLKAKCPFHNEKTPSFFVSPTRGSYYCFGCGASGDIFTFVEQFEGLDFKGALKFLAEKAQVTLSAYEKAEDQATTSEKERLYKVMSEAVKHFSENLSSNKEALGYLTKRGLNQESIASFNIGYAKDSWRALHEYLKGKSFTDQDIERAGLIKSGEKGPYDRFRGRIMFPISDSSGRVIAFSGRLFLPSGASAPGGIEQAKYINSPETPIFSKYLVLYGLDKAKESIRKNNFSILVEGQIDLVLSHQIGYRNTIATSGTALSDATTSKDNVVSNLGLIRRLSPNIVLAFDGDDAGFKAIKRAGKIALSLGMDVKVAPVPSDSDPADVILKSGTEEWKKIIKNSTHIVEFVLSKILQQYSGDARKAGKGVAESVLPFVSLLQSSVDKMHFIKKISDISGISESALQDDLQNVDIDSSGRDERKYSVEPMQKISRKDYIVRKLLGIILWQRSLGKDKNESIDPEAIIKEIIDVLDVDKDSMFENVEQSEADLIFEAEVFYKDGSNIEKDVAEMLGNLKEEGLKEELSEKMRELHQAESEKDQQKSAQILKECQLLNDKIQNIKNSRTPQQVD